MIDLILSVQVSISNTSLYVYHHYFAIQLLPFFNNFIGVLFSS